MVRGIHEGLLVCLCFFVPCWFTAVILCRWTGDSRRAMRLGDMLRESQSYLQPGSLPYIRNQNTYASLLLDQGKFSEAEELMWDLLESLRTAERSARADYVAARILQKLALICNIQGKYQQVSMNRWMKRDRLNILLSHMRWNCCLFLYVWMCSLIFRLGESAVSRNAFSSSFSCWKRASWLLEILVFVLKSTHGYWRNRRSKRKLQKVFRFMENCTCLSSSRNGCCWGKSRVCVSISRSGYMLSFSAFSLSLFLSLIFTDVSMYISRDVIL